MLEQQILEHARREAPWESCGLVIENNGVQHYQPCQNIAPRPEENFEIPVDEWLQAEQQGTITAVVHSHPGGPAWLSEADRAIQSRTNCDWWLVTGDSVRRYRNIMPLLGRVFEHGVMDCYTLFRDAYHLAGIELPDFERHNEWWLQEKELYLDNMADNGFFPVEKTEPGDILLICLGSARANHAAVYCGNQTILHHVPQRLSRRDIYGGFWQQYTHSIWRHKAWQPSAFTAICNDMAAVLN